MEMHEVREWGEFFVLDEFPTAKVKRLIIKEGKNISYQYHNHRSEFWTIVEGNGYVVLDGVLNKVGVGDTLTIEKNMKHSGYGDSRPKASNKTASGRAKNRRVEIKIYNKISSAAQN